MITIFHNNRCGKSRCALELLEKQTEPFQVFEYLKQPLTKEIIENLLKLLGKEPEEIIRKKEKVFLEKYTGKTYSHTEWVDILIENPILIERPIIIKGKKAIIARPPELVEAFLK